MGETDVKNTLTKRREWFLKKSGNYLSKLADVGLKLHGPDVYRELANLYSDAIYTLEWKGVEALEDEAEKQVEKYHKHFLSQPNNIDQFHDLSLRKMGEWSLIMMYCKGVLKPDVE